MPQAADINDSGTRGVLEEIKQQGGQGKMAEVIDAHLGLESVLRFSIWAPHNARIVEKNVEPIMTLRELTRKTANGTYVPKIEMHHFDLGISVISNDSFLRRFTASSLP